MCCFVIVLPNSSWRQHTPVFSSTLRGTGHDSSYIVPLPFPTMLPSSCSPSLSKHKFSYKSSPLWRRTRLPQLGSHSHKEILNLCYIIMNDNFIESVVNRHVQLLLSSSSSLCFSILSNTSALFSTQHLNSTPLGLCAVCLYVVYAVHSCAHTHTVCFSVTPWHMWGLDSIHHSFPLSSEEALESQRTHQPLTHNYLKELGESSCP